MDTKKNYSEMTHQEKSADVYNLARQINSREEQISEAISEETKIINLAHHAEPIIQKEYATLSPTQEQEIKDSGDGYVYGADKYIGQTIFGVKDRMQPIDEYIEEIKQSKFYAFFVENVSNKVEGRISTSEAFHDFSREFKTLNDIKRATGEYEGGKKEISFEMIRSIEKRNDTNGEYLVAYSSSFSETPEFDTISLEEARNIFEGVNISAKEFTYNFLPYLNEKEGLLLYSELVEKNEPKELFIYGMRSRPFDVGTFPDREGFISAKVGETRFGEDPLVGENYYNMLIYTTPLSKEDVENFQLDDMNYLNRGGERWDKIVSTTEYLAKRGKESDFLSENFFHNIKMDEDEFLEILSVNGIENPSDLYKVIANDLKVKELEHEESPQKEEPESTDSPSKKKSKTKSKRNRP